MKVTILYPTVKQFLGLTPAGKPFRCCIQRGSRQREVLLIADANGEIETPRGWKFAENVDIEEMEQKWVSTGEFYGAQEKQP